MHKYSEQELRAYAHALNDRFKLGITILDYKMNQEARFFWFRGMLPRGRKEQTIVVPLFEPKYGIVKAMSVLAGAYGPGMKWLVNGQACGGCKELVHLGSNSDKGLSLHISKDMLKSWTHENADRIPEEHKAAQMTRMDANYEAMIATGEYTDEVTVGEYVDDGGEYLKLKLSPLITQPDAEVEQELAGPRF